MPFIAEDEEERRRREAEEGGGLAVSGTQTGTIPGAGGSPTSPGGKPDNAFVDVAAYLQANRPQSMDTAQRVAGKLSEEEQGLRSGLQGASEGYEAKVKSGTINPDTDLVERAATDPLGFSKDSASLSAFDRQRDAQYTGPGNFEETPEFADVLQRVKSGQEKAKGIDTSAGRRSYLHSIGNNPTQGVVSLDDLLIGGDKDARGVLQTAASRFDTLSPALADATKRASDQLTAGRGTTEAARTGVANRFSAPGGVIPTFQAGLDEKLAKTKTEAQRNAEMLRGGIQRGEALTPQEREQIGAGNWDEVLKNRELLGKYTPFTDSRAKYDRQIDLLPYLAEDNPDVAFTRENVASADDYAKESALQRLSGNNFDVLPDDPRLAGTAPKSLSRIQGDPASDLRNLLGELDTTFIDQYKDMNLGQFSDQAPDPLTGKYAPDSWQSYFSQIPNARSYQGMIDIYNRNPDKINPLQRGVADQVQSWLDELHTLPPTNGGDGLTPSEPTGTDRLRIADGQMNWWDGNAWVAAPPETRKGANGKWEKFNYETGQYEPLPDGSDPVMRAS